MAERESFNILKTKLTELSATHSPSQSSSSSSSDCFNFRTPHFELRQQVNERLRQVNEIAFEPRIISIGPNHRGRYPTMEIHKFRYLRNLLQHQVRANQCANVDESLGIFIAYSQTMEEKARNFYEGTPNMISSAEFVAMMVLDGLFVVELLRKFSKTRLLVEENDDIFKQNLNLTIIAQDLLLLENQLPFFVLDLFWEKTKLLLSEKPLEIMAIYFFSSTVPLLWRRLPQWTAKGRSVEAKHLLGLVHDYSVPSSQEEIHIHRQRIEPSELLGFSSIRSATELVDVGITFKKLISRNRTSSSSSVDSLFNIKFENGQMHIPTLIVDHDTERIFRNLIAYEQFNQGCCPSIVKDYARLMDCLINHADDVALLSYCGIIDNRLGTKEEVAYLFNKLNDYVYLLSTANFYYSKLFHDVNEHCNRPLNLWKVKLRQKYFNTPWDWVLTSIAAASILLLLTLVQTIFSVLAYYK